jgi:hypothetical protein
MMRRGAEQGHPVSMTDVRVRAILQRGAIWDESEFTLFRSVLPFVHSRAMAGRIGVLLHAFEYGENEDAA